MTDQHQALAQDIAPRGRLRAALNLGNKVLVQGNASDGVKGITPALAKEFGKRLGLDVDFVFYDRAEDVFQSVSSEAWDICFLANDPARAGEIAFSKPYVSIAGIHVVPVGSPIRNNADVDQPNVRIGVSSGSAYDLFLTRSIKKAKIVRIKDSNNVPQMLVRKEADVASGIFQPMEAFVTANPAYRLLGEPFMEITQAMGMPAGRSAKAVDYLRSFVDDVKASGFVRSNLDRNGQSEVMVAR